MFSTAAFLVANLWNFQLNRTWTFKSGKHAGWLTEYWPFLLIGLVGQAISLVIVTLLMHPTSPIGLPVSFFDDSTGFRTKLYWAQLISIAIVTPLSFLFNKLWIFSAGRPQPRSSRRPRSRNRCPPSTEQPSRRRASQATLMCG